MGSCLKLDEVSRSLSTEDDGHMSNQDLLPSDFKWTEPTDLKENQYICRLDKLGSMLNNLV
jgi:hypothetical protein